MVGCTSDSDATANTGAYNSAGTGVPIHWLNGNKVADDYPDFYDGSWDDEANDKNELGDNGPDTSQTANFPLTGCQDYGEEANLGGRSLALGQPTPRVGRPNSSATNAGPIHSLSFVGPSDPRPMYGLSQMFKVGAPTDVTLRDLELEGAPGGETIVLIPAFDSATETYTASVANRIAAVTLTATKNDTNATVAIASDDDTSTEDEAELNLSVGSNTLTLTAEDATPKTYTITVTRATAPPTPTGAPRWGWGTLPCLLMCQFSRSSDTKRALTLAISARRCFPMAGPATPCQSLIRPKSHRWTETRSLPAH